MLVSVLPVWAAETDSHQPAATEPVAPVALSIKKTLSKAKATKLVEQADEKSKVAKEKIPFYFNPFKRIAHDSKVILTPEGDRG